ncbi:DNA repair protein RadA [Orientia chuto str. Dubai]|uniref:DNA repair protein RadA n=2 Tax=Candidatus Orientia mediorientalis TaxID=911112 RepID=A0A0F3MJF6_9RICK|nr:DNA repair protein RadA [Orientia chuto str. Dubai]
MKTKKQYTCTNCGSISYKWYGRCSECNEWNSLIEDVVSNSIYNNITNSMGTNLTISSLDKEIDEHPRIVSSINELNRVLGGGLILESAILIGGDPGIGKSTLLLQLCAQLSTSATSCLYISGEESVNQIKLRAQRLGLTNTQIKLVSATNIHDIITTIKANKQEIHLVVIDSIQTIYNPDITSIAGTTSQVRAAAQMLISLTKLIGIALIMVGHITKDGQLAGPKILEHMVDTVLYLEGSSNYQYRLLRAIKNRFGKTNEIGVFTMEQSGLIEVSNPSEMFILNNETSYSGTSVFASMEGSRPILVEIQALISPSYIPTPRRSVVGWDSNRLSMILAVLAVRYGLTLAAYEVYLSVAGGLKITEPAVDLAVAASLISAASNKTLPPHSIFFGEISLSGEIRKATQPDLRINEAIKLGFKNIFCTDYSNNTATNLNYNIYNIKHIKQLKNIL